MPINIEDVEDEEDEADDEEIEDEEEAEHEEMEESGDEEKLADENYFEKGNKKIREITEYSSNNTQRLSVEQMKKLLKRLEEFK